MSGLSASGEIYALTDLRTGETSIVSLADAANRMELDPDEILWAIEEWEGCETEQWLVRPTE